MKPVARALDDAARQLSPTSDTARLDAELLMAEAFHIDRDRLLLSPPERDVPGTRASACAQPTTRPSISVTRLTVRSLRPS